MRLGVSIQQSDRLGLTNAIILHRICQRIRNGDLRMVDGLRWFTSTAASFQQRFFSWLAIPTIATSLNGLERNGVLLSRRFGRNRTKSYSVTQSVAEESVSDHVFFESDDARSHGVNEALVLENLRIRFRATSEANFPQVAIDLRPRDLAARLPISERSVSRALSNLTTRGVLERIPSREERCSRFRPGAGMMQGQYARDPFSMCADCRLIAPSERAHDRPLRVARSVSGQIPDQMGIVPMVVQNVAEFASQLELQSSGGQHFADAMIASVRAIGMEQFFALSLNCSYGEDLHHDIASALFQNEPLEFPAISLATWVGWRLRFPASLPSLTDTVLYSCDYSSVLYGVDSRPIRSPRFELQPEALQFRILEGLYASQADRYAQTRVQQFLLQQRSPTIDDEQSAGLAPEAKTRVFFNALNSRLRTGIWSGHWGWQPFEVTDSEESTRTVYDFFRLNPAVTVCSLLLVIEAFNESGVDVGGNARENGDSSELQYGGYERMFLRPLEIGNFLRNFDRFVRRLELADDEFRVTATRAPNRRPFCYDKPSNRHSGNYPHSSR